jgi:hypothetical protein
MKLQDWHKALILFSAKGFGMTGAAIPIVYSLALQCKDVTDTTLNLASYISPWIWAFTFLAVGFFATCGFIITEMKEDGY